MELTNLLSPSTSLVENIVVLSKSKKITVRCQNELLKSLSDTYKILLKGLSKPNVYRTSKNVVKKTASEIRIDNKKLENNI